MYKKIIIVFSILVLIIGSIYFYKISTKLDYAISIGVPVKGSNSIGIGAITINNDFSEAEIEYMLIPDYWGKGYGSEIVRNLLKKAEETKSIHKVIAITDPNNFVSKKILFNNGFVSSKIFEIEDGSLAEMHSKEIMHF